LLAGIVVIGVLGLALEKLVFQRLRFHGRALGDDHVMSGRAIATGRLIVQR
jgi:hypothetical protein